jgi:predicted heme/steroid binding protein
MINRKVFGKALFIIVALILIFTVGYYIFKPKTEESEAEKLNRVISSEEQLIMAENVFSKEKLAQYNGKNGMEAYIAINGIVYDVSKKWKNGQHHGLEAGKDLTKEFLESPHGHKTLGKLKIVGQYQEE